MIKLLALCAVIFATYWLIFYVAVSIIKYFWGMV